MNWFRKKQAECAWYDDDDYDWSYDWSTKRHPTNSTSLPSCYAHGLPEADTGSACPRTAAALLQHLHLLQSTISDGRLETVECCILLDYALSPFTRRAKHFAAMRTCHAAAFHNGPTDYRWSVRQPYRPTCRWPMLTLQTDRTLNRDVLNCYVIASLCKTTVFLTNVTKSKPGGNARLVQFEEIRASEWSSIWKYIRKK